MLNPYEIMVKPYRKTTISRQRVCICWWNPRKKDEIPLNKTHKIRWHHQSLTMKFIIKYHQIPFPIHHFLPRFTNPHPPMALNKPSRIAPRGVVLANLWIPRRGWCRLFATVDKWYSNGISWVILSPQYIWFYNGYFHVTQPGYDIHSLPWKDPPCY